MASEFLSELKKSVEVGNFNSDAAKKINEIANLADSKSKNIKKEDIILDDNNDLVGVETTPEFKSNLNYYKVEDFILKQISFIKNIDNEIKLSIDVMFEYIETIKEEIEKNKETGDFSPLLKEIEKIEDKFKLIK
jgi:hypothetical protein